MHIGILVKPSLDASSLKTHLELFNHSVTILELSPNLNNHTLSLNLVIAYGGDGTVLAAAQHAIFHNCPLYGLQGGTFGFLHSGTTTSLPDDLQRLEEHTVHIIQRCLLEVSVNDENFYALNDVVMTCTQPVQMLECELAINNQIASTYRADGVVIASATGSTAYSLSAGGPILEPHVEAMIISPIAPHSLNQRSIVVSAENLLTLQSPHPAIITIDGQTRLETKECHIQLSKTKLSFISPHEKTFFKILQEKFHWG